MMYTVMTSILSTEDDSRKQFYQKADEYIKSLNMKFQEKTVITLAMNDKILRCLPNKYPQELFLVG